MSDRANCVKGGPVTAAAAYAVLEKHFQQVPKDQNSVHVGSSTLERERTLDGDERVIIHDATDTEAGQVFRFTKKIPILFASHRPITITAERWNIQEGSWVPYQFQDPVDSNTHPGFSSIFRYQLFFGGVLAVCSPATK